MDQPVNAQPGQSGGKSALAIIGVSAIAVICCAGPALLAAGALTTVGAFLVNPWVIAVGIALLVGLVAVTIRRSRAIKANCCAPDDEK